MRTTVLTLSLLSLVACKGGDDRLVEIFAGVPGVQAFGPENVPARESPLNLVVDMTVGPDGSVYVLDFNNHRIRVVGGDGTIRTVSGNGMLGDGLVIDGVGHDGPAMDVQWNHPSDVTFAPGDPDNLWVAAWHNSRVNRVDLAADWFTFEVGTGGRNFGGDGGPADVAVLDLPSSVAFDADGNMYISDQANQIIRVVDTSGTIQTIAGQVREYGYAGDGGPAADAKLHGGVGQQADPSSRIAVAGRDLYLADTRNQLIRKIDLDTMKISRVAGNFQDNGHSDDPNRAGGVTKYEGDGGDPLDAWFANPRDLAVGPDGEVYVADTDNHCVRVIHEGVIDTFAGTCGVSGDDGDDVPATEALLDTPYGVEVDSDGTVYIADTYNNVVRVVRPGKGKKKK